MLHGFNKNTIIIIPQKKSYFNILFGRFPVIIVKNKEEYKDFLPSFDIIIPDKIKLTNWGLLIIDFNKYKPFYVKYNLSIRFEDKHDIEKFKEIYFTSTPQQLQQ